MAKRPTSALRWVVTLTCIALSMPVVAYLLYVQTRPARLPPAAFMGTPTADNEPPLARDGARLIRKGDVVVITTWAGVIPQPPARTERISMDAGRIGIVKSAGLRKDVVNVLWLPQTWAKFPKLWEHVDVPAFHHTINVDWIEPLEVERVASSGAVKEGEHVEQFAD